MSKLKRAYIVLLGLFFTMAVCIVGNSNNVYASTKVMTVTNGTVIEGDIAKRLLGFKINSWSGDLSTGHLTQCSMPTASVTIKVKTLTGTTVAQNTVSGTRNCYYRPYYCEETNQGSGGRWCHSTSMDASPMASITTPGQQTYTIDYSYQNQAPSSIDITLLLADSPIFQANSYVQSNGNLTAQKMS